MPSKERVYLDYAAATPLDDSVQKQMSMASAFFANPSAQYRSAHEAHLLLEDARKQCALFMQANAEEIVFTSGATESNNLAILGAARAHKKGRIISIGSEHSSVREPLEQLQKEGFDIKYAKIDKTGLVDLNHLASLINKSTRLVTISYANSEIGTIQPIAKIGQLIRAFNAANRTRVLLHSDASAACLVLSCDVSRLGVDLFSIGGAKVYGPHGSGLLYVKRGSQISPIQFGGGQESQLRAGTQSLADATGLAEALKIIKKSRRGDHANFKNLHDMLLAQLDNNDIAYLYNGHPKERLVNVISLIIESYKGEDMVAKLDAAGFEVSTGAACEASSDQPSRALMAIGLSVTQAQSSLRVSLGRATSELDIKRFAAQLAKILA